MFDLHDFYPDSKMIFRFFHCNLSQIYREKRSLLVLKGGPDSGLQWSSEMLDDQSLFRRQAMIPRPMTGSISPDLEFLCP